MINTIKAKKKILTITDAQNESESGKRGESKNDALLINNFFPYFLSLPTHLIVAINGEERGKKMMISFPDLGRRPHLIFN